MKGPILTVGHSNHALAHFIRLLRRHAVTAVGDVRSAPYSRSNPQYNRGDLSEALRSAGIEYLFLGRELGARSEDPSCYEDGKVRYDRLAETELFKKGIERITECSATSRLALMCAEREPLECHRTILVAKQLAARGLDVQHIHADGALESHDDAITRLIRLLKMPQEDMFRSREEIVEDACKKQEERIAYRTTASTAVHPDAVVGHNLSS